MDQLYDIYGTWYVPWWQRSYVYYSALAALTLCAVFLLLLFFVRRRRAIVAMTPWDQALLECQQLHTKSDTTSGRLWYYELTQILKKYIHQRYGLNAHSYTDQELLAQLQALPIEGALIEQFKILAQTSMMAKFAKDSGLQEQMARDLALSITLIKSTVPADDKH